MNDFKFIDYCTKYSASGDIKIPLSVESCFRSAFNRYTSTKTVNYEIFMYRGLNEENKGKLSNACFLDPRTVYNHINLLKALCDFKFKVECSDNHYRILVTVDKLSSGMNKYILTWIRYMYEFPYNVLLLDTYRLKKNPIFKFQSIANIFNITLKCYCQYVRSVHQVPDDSDRVCELLTNKQLKEKINSHCSLNDIYGTRRFRAWKIPEESKIVKCSCTDIEYWIDDELFLKERENIYLSTYKKLISQ